MKENIKDYLHLYFGCEGELIAPDGIPYVGTEKLNTWLLNEIAEKRKSFIPILKPFSYKEMPEKEKRRFEDETEGSLNYYLLTARQAAWLLKNHYDIFGLIKAGLAIDATTLPNIDKNDERIATQQASNQGGNAGINK
jgi:hypothetical protein